LHAGCASRKGLPQPEERQKNAFFFNILGLSGQAVAPSVGNPAAGKVRQRRYCPAQPEERAAGGQIGYNFRRGMQPAGSIPFVMTFFIPPHLPRPT
jgi:hypothetical protein